MSTGLRTPQNWNKEALLHIFSLSVFVGYCHVCTVRQEGSKETVGQEVKRGELGRHMGESSDRWEGGSKGIWGSLLLPP